MQSTRNMVIEKSRTYLCGLIFDKSNNIVINYSSLINDICVATSIRELCESRDSEYTNFFDRNKSRKLIDFLCTT